MKFEQDWIKSRLKPAVKKKREQWIAKTQQTKTIQNEAHKGGKVNSQSKRINRASWSYDTLLSDPK